MNVTCLLVSSDWAFSATVREHLKDISDLEIEVIPALQEAACHIRRPDVVLLVIHIQSAAEARELQAVVEDLPDPVANFPILAVAQEGLGGQVTLDLLRLGVVDCLARPLDLNRLTFLVDSLTLRRRTEQIQGNMLRSRARKNGSPVSKNASREYTFLVTSPLMQRLVEQIQQIADRRNAIVITGETGTGKTHLARYIHEHSCWRQGKLIHMDCGAVPENLIEGELFGYRKGAFTGASQDYEGKCAAADGGTLFLDEIDALSPGMQTRLLRLTDEGRYSPIGVVQERTLNARIIAGTNRHLPDEVAAGRFRQDLYFRLSVFELQVPPLRQRPEEIRPLVEYFMQSVAAAHNTDIPEVDDAVWHALQTYDWHGNVRELRNVVERFMAFCSDGCVRSGDLPPAILHSSSRCLTSPIEDTLPDGTLPRHTQPGLQQWMSAPVTAGEDQLPSLSDSWMHRVVPELSPLAVSRVRGEVRKIVEVLRATENNRTLAAQTLGISREALYKKLRKYELMDFSNS